MVIEHIVAMGIEPTRLISLEPVLPGLCLLLTRLLPSEHCSELCIELGIFLLVSEQVVSSVPVTQAFLRSERWSEVSDETVLRLPSWTRNVDIVAGVCLERSIRSHQFEAMDRILDDLFGQDAVLSAFILSLLSDAVTVCDFKGNRKVERFGQLLKIGLSAEVIGLAVFRWLDGGALHQIEGSAYCSEFEAFSVDTCGGLFGRLSTVNDQSAALAQLVVGFMMAEYEPDIDAVERFAQRPENWRFARCDDVFTYFMDVGDDYARVMIEHAARPLDENIGLWSDVLARYQYEARFRAVIFGLLDLVEVPTEVRAQCFAAAVAQSESDTERETLKRWLDFAEHSGLDSTPIAFRLAGLVPADEVGLVMLERDFEVLSAPDRERCLSLFRAEVDAERLLPLLAEHAYGLEQSGVSLAATVPVWLEILSISR